jgi:uncharacterized protein YecE (DUF72 family)
MLRFYGQRFNSVEINYTFRKEPTEATVAAWREATPPGFRFTLKAHQRLTHWRRLEGVAEAATRFLERASILRDRLGPILFQCPPTLAYDPALVDALLDVLPPQRRYVFEFRHPSWRAAWDRLAERGIARCVADTDEAPASADELCWEPFGYLRLRRAAYSSAELETWAGRIGSALDAGRDVHCYFKHEDSAAGPRMAQALEAMVAASA